MNRGTLARVAAVAAAGLGAFAIGKASLDDEREDDKVPPTLEARTVQADAAAAITLRDPRGATRGVLFVRQSGTHVTGRGVVRGAAPGAAEVEFHPATTGCSRPAGEPLMSVPLRPLNAGSALVDIDERTSRSVLDGNGLVLLRAAGGRVLCGHVSQFGPATLGTRGEKGGGIVNVLQEGSRVDGRLQLAGGPAGTPVTLDVLPPDGRCEDGRGRRLMRFRLDARGRTTRLIRRRDFAATIAPRALVRARIGDAAYCGALPDRLVSRGQAETDNDRLAVPLMAEDEIQGVLDLQRMALTDRVFHAGSMTVWGLPPGAPFELAISGPGGTCSTRVPRTALRTRARPVPADGVLEASFDVPTEADSLIQKGYYARAVRAGAEPLARPAACGNLISPAVQNVTDYTIETENGRATGGPAEIEVARSDTIRLVVRVDERRRDVVEIERYGIREAASRSNPAEMLFPTSLDGSFAIRLRSTGSRIGTLVVRD